MTSELYNFYNLEASFREYVLSGNKKLSPVSIRNYTSDLRHFLGWYLFFLKASPKYAQIVDKAGDNYVYISNLSAQIIAAYRDYLQENRIPLRTINRRFSTLRRFCAFCISQGWLKENPAKQIANVGTAKEQSQVLNEFKKALEQDEIMPLEIRQVAGDVSEFLSS